jgi:integrase
MKRKNAFPGVTRLTDRHGKVRWRYRSRGFSAYIGGAYGSEQFRSEYEAAVQGGKVPVRSRADHGTVTWLIEQYLGSLRFKDLSDSRKRTIRLELDWLRGVAGQYHYASLQVRHVEALMGKKDGPVAANTVKKNLSMLFNFAAKKMGYTGPNPARHADRRKTNPDGYHTWTDDEVDRFLTRHGPGSKARLVLLLALNTGMARQDLTRAGRQLVSCTDGIDRIAYRRGKTSVAADMPILPELAEELRNVAADRMLFITHDGRDNPYTPAGFGNWFRDRCTEANVPGSLHGLRKAGATRLANAGASEWEIASYLAHTDTKEAATYTKKANRGRLSDSGFAKVNVTNLNDRLDNSNSKPLKGKN